MNSRSKKAIITLSHEMCFLRQKEAKPCYKGVLKVSVRNASRGTSLGGAIETARAGGERKKGLLGRTGLEPGGGMWIVPCEGIHTFFMKFAIDVIYIDRNKKVRKTITNLAPWRLSLCLTAHSVLELPVGVIEASGTTPGDQLAFGSVESVRPE